MSPEEKSVQYSDLHANERLLEIQAEIVSIEKRLIHDQANLSDEDSNELRARIKFLVSEEKLILGQRDREESHSKTIEVSDTQNQTKSELKQMINSEIAENKKIEGELQQIIQATKDRMWYEKWWGKLIIIVVGAVLVSLMGSETINISELVG